MASIFSSMDPKVGLTTKAFPLSMTATSVRLDVEALWNQLKETERALAATSTLLAPLKGALHAFGAFVTTMRNSGGSIGFPPMTPAAAADIGTRMLAVDLWKPYATDLTSAMDSWSMAQRMVRQGQTADLKGVTSGMVLFATSTAAGYELTGAVVQAENILPYAPFEGQTGFATVWLLNVSGPQYSTEPRFITHAVFDAIKPSDIVHTGLGLGAGIKVAIKQLGVKLPAWLTDTRGVACTFAVHFSKEAIVVRLPAKSRRGRFMPPLHELVMQSEFGTNLRAQTAEIWRACGIDAQTAMHLEALTTCFLDCNLKKEATVSQVIALMKPARDDIGPLANYIKVRSQLAVDKFGNVWGFTFDGVKVSSTAVSQNGSLLPGLQAFGWQAAASGGKGSNPFAVENLASVPTGAQLTFDVFPAPDTSLTFGSAIDLWTYAEADFQSSRVVRPGGDQAAQRGLGAYSYARTMAWIALANQPGTMPQVMYGDGSRLAGFMSTLKLNRTGPLMTWAKRGYASLPAEAQNVLMRELANCILQNKFLMPRWIERKNARDPAVRDAPQISGQRRSERVLEERVVVLPSEVVERLNAMTADPAARYREVFAEVVKSAQKLNAEATKSKEEPPIPVGFFNTFSFPTTDVHIEGAEAAAWRSAMTNCPADNYVSKGSAGKVAAVCFD